jgi:hypothetical protein
MTMDSVCSKSASTLDSKGEPLVAAMRTTVLLQASCCHCMLLNRIAMGTLDSETPFTLRQQRLMVF